MQNEMATYGHATNVVPFAQPQHTGVVPGMNVGAVTIEVERAVAEAKGQMQLAKMFPRDLQAAYAELMDACKQPAMANVAFYSVPQGGSKVTGPSIRLAEEIARVYGNFEYGHRELSRQEAGVGPKEFGRSEIEVYGWDKQTNNRTIRQLTVLHVMDTKDGPRKLRDQKDIDNKIANVASKQLRGRILAMMPKWMTEAAIEQCKATLAGDGSEPLSARVRKMTQAFATYGVTAEHLERYLGHKLDQTLADELANLLGVFSALREGTPVSEFFGATDVIDAEQAKADETKKTIEQAADKGRGKRNPGKGGAKDNPMMAQLQNQQQPPEAQSPAPEAAETPAAPEATDDAQAPVDAKAPDDAGAVLF